MECWRNTFIQLLFSSKAMSACRDRCRECPAQVLYLVFSTNIHNYFMKWVSTASINHRKRLMKKFTILIFSCFLNYSNPGKSEHLNLINTVVWRWVTHCFCWVGILELVRRAADSTRFQSSPFCIEKRLEWSYSKFSAPMTK